MGIKQHLDAAPAIYLSTCFTCLGTLRKVVGTVFNDTLIVP